jgi:peroxiredoxin
MPLLGAGDAFPRLPISVIEGDGDRVLTVPDAFGDGFGVVLFYRGAWCPYCLQQLRSFERARRQLDELGIAVVALSSEDRSTTAALTSDLGLTFPLGHSADPVALAAQTGAFVSTDETFLQSTGFVIDPHGRVAVSVYSSGSIGRLVSQDVVGLVRRLRERSEAAS